MDIVTAKAREARDNDKQQCTTEAKDKLEAGEGGNVLVKWL